MEKLWKQTKNWTSKMYGNIRNRSQFLRNLKLVLLMFVIGTYSVVYSRLINNGIYTEFEYILVATGLILITVVLFSTIDRIIDDLRLKEIQENNDKIAKESVDLSLNFKKLSEEQMRINKLGSKYETCWNSLKNWASNAENGQEWMKALDSIEELAEKHVDEIYKDMEEKLKGRK